MKSSFKPALRIAAFALIATTSLLAVERAAWAQDISDSHLSEARKALSATRATQPFDNILIQAATALKNRLTATNPDQVNSISETVDAEAIALAARRSDLETEAARAFAGTFTEAELKKISEFFSSDVGQKYLDSTRVIGRQLSRSAQVWGRGIQRDLTQNVTKKLSANK